MATRQGSAQLTRTPAPRPPWYARTATTAGRPLVLAVTLAMCAPGEYHLAIAAGWTTPWAYGMPLALSAYAGIAAVVASTLPRGARGRGSAVAGAVVAIALALAAQVVAHLIARGHMEPNQAWLIAVVSAVPPAVVGHLLHLASMPASAAPATATGPTLQVSTVEAPAPARPTAPPTAAIATAPAPPAVATSPAPVPAVAQAPAPTPAPAPARPTYTDPRCAVIRSMYDTGARPSAPRMVAALAAAGLTAAPSTAKNLRGKVESSEPHLLDLPAAI